MNEQPAKTGGGLLDPSFLLACAVLAAAAFGVSPVIFARGSADVKESVPLRRPLNELDDTKLGPYHVFQRNILKAAVEESLGTSLYIDWALEDTSVEKSTDPLRYIHLLVTYYTGNRDMVPHTPDRCYVGGGYEATKKADLKAEIPSLGREIPLRAVSFEKTAVFGREKPTVVYTFHCNGEFVCTRTGIRLRVNAPSVRHAYFCKIEVTFGSGHSRPRNPTREESIQGTAKFLDHFLPVLLDQHLPDWEAIQEANEAPEATVS